MMEKELEQHNIQVRSKENNLAKVPILSYEATLLYVILSTYK